MSEAEATIEPDLGGMIIGAPDNSDLDGAPAKEPEAKEPEAREPEAQKPAEPEAAESDDAQGSVTFTPEQQRAFDEAIGKRTARYRTQLEQEQAQRAELQQRLEALERGETLPQNDPETGAPVVPDMPDQWDENYEQKVQQRDQALLRRARWEAEQEALQAQQAQEQQQRIERLNEQAIAFRERGEKEYGLTAEDMRRNGQVVVDGGGLHEKVIVGLLEDDAGPAIVDYLAKNPGELDTFRGMDPYAAGRHVEKTLRKAALNVRKAKTAPPPVSTDKGGSRRDDGLPEGAAFL